MRLQFIGELWKVWANKYGNQIWLQSNQLELIYLQIWFRGDNNIYDKSFKSNPLIYSNIPLKLVKQSRNLTLQ
jgi:hypothetical protein